MKLLLDRYGRPVHGWQWLWKLYKIISGSVRKAQGRTSHRETSLRQWEERPPWKPTWKSILPGWSLLYCLGGSFSSLGKFSVFYVVCWGIILSVQLQLTQWAWIVSIFFVCVVNIRTILFGHCPWNWLQFIGDREKVVLEVLSYALRREFLHCYSPSAQNSAWDIVVT